MHQPFDVFCFVFVSHKKHHAIILKIQNPSLEIKRDPSHVTFFNIGHEVRREIDNIKCPSVYRLTQIQNIFSMCISWHGYVWKEIIFIGLAHPFFTALYCPEEETFFFFLTDFLIFQMNLRFYHGDLLQRWLLIIGCWVLKWDPKNKRRLIHLTKFKFLIVFLKIGLKSI